MSETPSNPTSDVDPPRPGILRRIYDWVLGWADTPYGTPVLAVVSFTESSFFPIPPDPLLMALTLARPRRAAFYAMVCTVTSVLGGLMGYWIGLGAMEWLGKPILEFYGRSGDFAALQEKYQNYAFLTILGAALTPIPYKVFTIAAGACRVAIPTLIFASLLGRGLRFFAVALLLGAFGKPMRNFIDRYFNLLCALFFLVLILGFIAVKMLL